MAKLIGGTTFGQVAMIAALPLLTRIYQPEAFTALAVIGATTAILAPLVSLRFDHAVLTARDDEEAGSITVLSLMTVLVISAVISVTILLITPFFDTSKLASRNVGLAVIAAVPIAAALQGGVYTLTQLSFFRQDFVVASWSKVLLGVATVLAQAACGLFLPTGTGLVVGFVLGLAATLIYLAICHRTFIARALACASRATLATTARAKSDFVRYTTPSNMINAAGFQLQPLVIIALFGPAVGGLYFLGMKAVSVPGRFIGMAVSGAFWADAARLYRDDPRELRRRHLLIAGGLAAFGLPGFLLLPFGEVIFGFIFGEEWQLAGKLAGIIWVGAYAAFVTDCTGSLVYYGKNVWMSAWEVGRLLVLILVAITIWKLQLDAVAGAWLIAAATVIVYVILFLLNALAIWRRIGESGGQEAVVSPR